MLVIFGASCKKDPPDIMETGEWGEANSVKNGADWQALCATRLNKDGNKFSLGFNQYDSQHYFRNGLNVRNLPYSIGQYSPFQYKSTSPDSLLTISFFTHIEDGDVLGDKYILLKDSSFCLRINAVDYQSGVITGTFEGQFRKEITPNPERDPSSPDTLRFENGTFKARVKD